MLSMESLGEDPSCCFQLPAATGILGLVAVKLPPLPLLWHGHPASVDDVMSSHHFPFVHVSAFIWHTPLSMHLGPVVPIPTRTSFVLDEGSLSDHIFTWLHLQRPYSQIRSHSQVSQGYNFNIFWVDTTQPITFTFITQISTRKSTKFQAPNTY